MNTSISQQVHVVLTREGLELPVQVSNAPVEGMDAQTLRYELARTRERCLQFEHTLDSLVDQYDRNLRYLFSLPALPQARVLVGREP